MSRVRVNYKSDLPPVAVKFKINGSVVDVPSHDFVIRFFVDGAPGTSFECAHKGDEYINCTKTADDTLTCYINNHKFGCGRLCCEFIDLSADSRYKDKVLKTVTPSALDVVLVEGAGDSNVEVLNIIFGYEINEIAEITAVESQEEGGTNTITITQTNNEEISFGVKNGTKGSTGKSAYQSYVDTTIDDPVKSEAEWVNSLHGGDGIDGSNGVGFQSVVAHNPVDGAMDITLTNGDVLTIDLQHNHDGLIATGEIDCIKFHVCEDETEYTGISTKDANTLYLIPASS